MTKNSTGGLLTGQKISINGENVILGRKLGEGGTKTVYEASINGRKLALMICRAKDANNMYNRWKTVMNEPDNTRRIRSIGIHTNPFMEIGNLAINGVIFPCIMAIPHSELPYDVCDRKNNSNNSNSVLEGRQDLNDSVMIELFEDIMNDVVKLVLHRIQLSEDSVNICTSNGKMYMFVMDIPTISMINESYINEAINTYISFILGAVMNSTTWDTFDNSQYLRKLDGNTELRRRIKEKILNKLKEYQEVKIIL